MIYISLITLAALALVVVGYMNLPKFGRSPQGERLARIERSPNYRDGMFRNLEETPQITSDKSRTRVMLDFLFEKRERNRPDKPLKAVSTDLKALGQDGDLFVWFGHSSYFLQSSGKRMLVDPVFEEAAPLAFLNRPFQGTDLYKAADMPEIDYLIITHDHWDHLDYKTVTDLRGWIGKVVCPLGVGEHFERWGFDKGRVVEMDWDEKAGLGDGITIHCLPARHFSGRTLRSNRTLWASFMLETPTRTIYLSGDGGYGSHFARIARQFPHIDLAIMENGQYNENWRYIHLMPEYLEQAIRELNPRMVMAGHNGKYALAKHPWDEPLDHAVALASDSMNIVLPVIGEVVHLRDTVAQVKKWWKSPND